LQVRVYGIKEEKLSAKGMLMAGRGGRQKKLTQAGYKLKNLFK